jgi:hypothetical protein
MAEWESRCAAGKGIQMIQEKSNILHHIPAREVVAGITGWN